MSRHLLTIALLATAACTNESESTPDTRSRDSAGPVRDLAAFDMRSDLLVRDGAMGLDATIACGTLPIVKHPCPWPSGTICPVNQFCLDFRDCVKLTCNQTPDCTVAPEVSFHLYATGPLGQALPSKISGTVKNSTSTSFLVSSSDATAHVAHSLPADMQLPVKDGDQLTLELCPHGPPINLRHSIRAFNQNGELLFAGAAGIDATKPSCSSTTGLQITREDRGCTANPPSPPYAEGPFVSFALRFQADTTVSLAQRARGIVTFQSHPLAVANFISFHPIEWAATDIYGAIEYYALVRKN